MGPVPFERYFQGLQKTSQFRFSMTSSKESKLRLKVAKVSKFCVGIRFVFDTVFKIFCKVMTSYTSINSSIGHSLPVLKYLIFEKQYSYMIDFTSLRNLDRD